ncbi:MAG: hypothetical protein KGL63_09470 [Betaproteobacteria bacterium]|nr:hypothetical protein [Betaproteobacteria bacterium]
MINTFLMVGVLERVHISEPRKKDKASGAIVVRYGDDRNQSGGQVEFLNAALIRIPPYRLPAIRDRLREGAFVHVVGHIQGVYKHQAGQGVLDTELVADRVDFVQGLNSVRGAYRKGTGPHPHADEGGEAPTMESGDPGEGEPSDTDADRLLSGAGQPQPEDERPADAAA